MEVYGTKTVIGGFDQSRVCADNQTDLTTEKFVGCSLDEDPKDEDLRQMN